MTSSVTTLYRYSDRRSNRRVRCWVIDRIRDLQENALLYRVRVLVPQIYCDTRAAKPRPEPCSRLYAAPTEAEEVLSSARSQKAGKVLKEAAMIERP